MVTLQERAESSTVAKGQQGHSHCIPACRDQCDALTGWAFHPLGNHPVLAHSISKEPERALGGACSPC